jgi:hypothetical protein
MNKFTLLIFLLPTLAFSCPTISGTYPHCHSEIKQMKGEYDVNQYSDNGTEIYTIKYTDDEGNVQEDQFKTDGKQVKRKQNIPTINIKVTVEGSATCDGDKLVSIGKAYFLGANVGKYNTTIYKENNVLTMKIAAEYLGKSVDKLIQCTEK